jgi:EAL domain-containing protein (putative c-di-GMP-specific phosphodiesterase class I)
MAEGTGQIWELGRWILRRAAADAARLNREHPGRRLVGVEVNVSPHQVADPRLADEVRAVLAETRLDPALLVIEITESVLLHDAAAATAALHQLKNLGVRLALDDFGTGYSSLSYLRSLPIDILKIDKTFVDGVKATGRELALVEGIVRIAEAFELDVIAEGVETERQRAALAAAGCGFGQGYLFSRPIDLPEAAALLG